MDINKNIAPEVPAAQSPQELTDETKRLLLGCHLNLVFRRLRRGVCVEERELLALLPFTVRSGWRPENAARDEFEEPVSPSDADWTRRIAEASALP